MLGVEVLTCAGRTPVAADEGKNVSEVPAIPVDAQRQGAVVEEGRVAEGVCVLGVKRVEAIYKAYLQC